MHFKKKKKQASIAALDLYLSFFLITILTVRLRKIITIPTVCLRKKTKKGIMFLFSVFLLQDKQHLFIAGMSDKKMITV